MDNVWTNLGNRLETAWKRPTRPNSKRPKDGEIIDEEKSVRWNREEVVRRQKAWDAECSRLKKAQNAEIEHISEAIELQIQEDIKAETKRSISKKAATILWQKAYDRGHAYGFADIYCAIEDYEELVVAVLTNGAAMIARMIILVNCTKMERYLWSRLLVNFSRANILVQAAQPMYLTMVYHITHMGIVSRTTPLRLAAPL